MIASITGKLISKKTHSIVIDVHGVGLELSIANADQLTLNTQISVATILHWNQEAGPQLFGFLQESEKMLFSLVTSCAGCGPKIGLSVVAHMGLNEFIDAIEKNDSARLSAINGIGKKKAEQIILSLKDKIGHLDAYESQTTPFIAHIKKLDEVLSSLGYSRQEIMIVIELIKKQDILPTDGFDVILRKALTLLAKK